MRTWGKGYDCLHSRFQFSDLRSSGFDYQVTRYTELPRAVVLCMDHNLVNPPEHIDVVELATLADYLGH